MDTMRQTLAATLMGRRDHYVELATRPADPSAGESTLGTRDVAQMIDGFLALLVEGLQGESRETRDFFLETLIPSLVPAHMSAADLLSEVTGYAILLSGDAVAALPEAEREDGRRWFADFFRDYVRDLARIASEESA